MRPLTIVRLSGTLLLAIALCRSGAEGAPAEAEGAEAVSRHVLDRLAAQDHAGLVALAARVDPDPWLVADELEAAGRQDAVVAFAEALPHETDRKALLAYAAGRRGASDDLAGRAALRAALAPGVTWLRVTELLRGAATDAAPPSGAPTLLQARSALRHLQALLNSQPAPDAPLQRATAGHCQRLMQRLGWNLGELDACVRAAKTAEDQGREAEAIEWLESCLPLAALRPEWVLSGRLFDALGRLYESTGNRSAARAAFRDAAEAFQRAGKIGRQALALSNLGELSFSDGRFVESLSLHQEAQALLGAGTEPAIGIEIEQRIATVMERVGRLPEARRLLRAALDQVRMLSPADPEGDALILGNLSRVHFLAGDPAAAAETLARAEAAYQALDLPAALRLCAIHRAWYEANGEVHERTLTTLAELVSAPPQDMTLREELHARVAWGRCLIRQGRAEQAVAVFDTARARSTGLPPTDDLPGAILGGYARALEAAGRSAEALAPLEACLASLVRRTDGLEPGSSLTMPGLELNEILASGQRATRHAGAWGLLWRVLESSRGLRLLAALGGRSALGEAVLPAGVQQRLATARSNELAARRDLAVARAAGAAEDQRLGPLEKRLAAAEGEKETAARLADEGRRIRDADDLGVAADPLRLEDLRWRPGEALVHLSLLPEDDTLVAFVATAQGSRVTLLRGRKALLALLRRFRGAAAQGGARSVVLDAPAPRAVDLGAPLGDIRKALIAPLALGPDVRTLYVVPDGELTYAPYAALLADRDVCVVPSGTLWQRLKARARRAGSVPLAVGDPDVTGPVLVSDLASIGDFLPGDAPRTALRLRPLPGTRVEAEAVGGKDALLGERATGIELLKVLAAHPERRWSTIHFACHGVINPDFPTLSGLALSDGLLTAHEIFALRLNTDLVVLSACDTATDAYVMGEGISGLVRAFLYAGAPRVLASLWKVPDEPTAALMTKFYELLRADPQGSVAKALREAQAHVSTVDGGKWAAPENWAAWTLWGVP